MKRAAALLLPLTLGGCIVASEKPDFDTRLIIGGTPPSSATAGGAPIPLAPPVPCSDLPAVPSTSQRNSCIFRIKSRIDDSYLNYRLLITKQIGLANEGLDVGSVTSSAVATATTGVAARVMAGLATTLTGARTAFNNDALYQQSLHAIFKQMEADRLGVWANIQIAMQANTYTMAQAENDLLGYFRAGTVEDALNSLDASAGTAQVTCKAASDAVGAAKTAVAVKAEAEPAGSPPAGAGLQVAPPKPATAQQPAATTTAEQCSQIIASADKTLALATVKTPDIAANEASLSKSIKALGQGDKAKLDAVASALGVPVSPDYAAERGNVLMALRAIDDPDKLTEAADRIKAAIGED